MKGCSKFENSAGHWSEKILSCCKTAWEGYNRKVLIEKEVEVWKAECKYRGYLDNFCFLVLKKENVTFLIKACV